jgi:hypothetical protein
LVSNQWKFRIGFPTVFCFCENTFCFQNLISWSYFPLCPNTKEIFFEDFASGKIIRISASQNSRANGVNIHNTFGRPFVQMFMILVFEHNLSTFDLRCIDMSLDIVCLAPP